MRTHRERWNEEEKLRPFNTSSISVEEMIQAGKDIIISVQEEAFQKEISILGSTEFHKVTSLRAVS